MAEDEEADSRKRWSWDGMNVEEELEKKNECVDGCQDEEMNDGGDFFLGFQPNAFFLFFSVLVVSCSACLFLCPLASLFDAGMESASMGENANRSGRRGDRQAHQGLSGCLRKPLVDLSRSCAQPSK